MGPNNSDRWPFNIMIDILVGDMNIDDTFSGINGITIVYLQTVEFLLGTARNK